MLRAAQSGFIAAVVAASAGCEPGWSIHGQVVHPAAASSLVAPLRGALVVLRCPGPSGTHNQAVRADEQGAFQLEGPGPGPSLSCSLTVVKNGYSPLAYTIDEICADEDESGRRCSAAALQAEMKPQQP